MGPAGGDRPALLLNDLEVNVNESPLSFPARDADRITSKWAALFLPRQRRITELWDAIVEHCPPDPDGCSFTDSDLARWVGWDRNIAARRRQDLCEIGLVEDQITIRDGGGYYPTVRQGPAGRMETVWTMSQEGREAAGWYKP